MRDPRRLAGATAVGRLLGVAGAVVLLGVALVPAALAQTDEVPEAPDSPDDVAPTYDRWAESEFDFPFDESAPTVRSQELTVAGTFRYEKSGPADHIVEAVVRIVDDPSDDFTPAASCELPDPQVVPGAEPEPDLYAELAFAVGAELPCNGRYLVEAEATLDDPDAPTYTMRRSFLQAVLPEPISELSVALDEDERAATVSFTPLTEDELAPDAVGYAIERAGPSGTEGVYGMYEDVATLGLDDAPRVVDDLMAAEAGHYSYRVRALRVGADEPVRSSIIGTESAGITLGDPPPSTTTSEPGVTNRGSARGGRVVVSRPANRAAPRLTTPTTLDTGFDETLDYGARTGGTDGVGPDGDALAGQSIVRDEGGEPMDLVVPAAGALVLLGWAGHLVYLNRLAKQL